MSKINIALKNIIIVLAFSISSCKTMHSPKNSGIVSSEVWFEEDEYNPEATESLTKKNGEDFRILLLADIQISGSPWTIHKTFNQIDELIDSVKPDFIMTLGDNTEWRYSDKMAKKLIRFMEKKNIPWGVVLGNHDSAEGRKARPWYGNRYEEAKNSMFKYGPNNIKGVGNYIVNINDENGDVIYTLAMMDSNNSIMYKGKHSYDFIHRDQQNWYKWQIEGISKTQYGTDTKVVPSMCFFHIPLLEFDDAQKAVKEGKIDKSKVRGDNSEAVASSKINSGFFDVLKDVKSTTHVFCGHDHVNDMSIEYEGIILSYGLKTGHTSYFDEKKQGGVLVTIKAGNNNKNESTGKVDMEYIYLND